MMHKKSSQIDGSERESEAWRLDRSLFNGPPFLVYRFAGLGDRLCVPSC
jgi:hypothetical protein